MDNPIPPVGPESEPSPGPKENVPVPPPPAEGEEIELPLDLSPAHSRWVAPSEAPPAPAPVVEAKTGPVEASPAPAPEGQPALTDAAPASDAKTEPVEAATPSAPVKPKRGKRPVKPKKTVRRKKKVRNRIVFAEPSVEAAAVPGAPESVPPRKGKGKAKGKGPATPAAQMKKIQGPPPVPTPSPAANYPFVRFRRLALPLAGAEPQGLERPRPAAEPSWPKNPKVSVVVYNHNGADRLWNFLFALKTQSYRAHEVILVDNRSTDMSVSFVRANHPEVRILELQERFPEPQAVNLGFMEAGSDLVAVVQSTLALPPDWLKRSVEAFQARAADAGAVACPVHGRAGWEPVEVFNVIGQVVGKEAPYPGGEPFHPYPGAVLYRRRLFPDGLYDEELPFGPDAFTLGWRLRSQGYHLYWAFEAKVLKPSASGLQARGSTFRNDYDAERKRWAAMFTCTEGSTFMKLLPLLALDAVLRPFTRWFHPAGSFWGTVMGTGMAWVRKGTLAGVKNRNAERRRVTDYEVARFLSGKFTSRKGLLADLMNALSSSYVTAAGFPVKKEAPGARSSPSGRRP